VARQFFGTDGIRGQANSYPVTPEIAMKLGMAAGHYFRDAETAKRVVIAKDTRLSGYMLEQALAAGLEAVGQEVMFLGPMPTPAVAMLTRSLRANLGVMISASHNPYEDNGIKLFGPDGHKLCDETELAIEALMLGDLEQLHVPAAKLGKARRLEDAPGRYVEFVKSAFPRKLDLKGLKIVMDCANGAAYRIGPSVLWELGAEVVAIGVEPDGFNINRECGSTYPQALQARVVKEKADIGIALDGDADRLILCDEEGELIDGDQLMAMVATELHRRGALEGGGVVAPQMSNMGLERYLKGLGLTLYRSAVGDRYVVQMMREKGCNFGGEQSGHIILSDYATTGDGLMAALQVLALLREERRPLSQLAHQFEPLPQILKNVRFSGDSPLERVDVKTAITDAETQLNGHGRVFIRKSGTEPMIRVMAEGEDERQVRKVVDELVQLMAS